MKPYFSYWRIVLAMVLISTISLGEVRAQQILSTAVLVVGGGTGGVAAGIQCARMGVKTLVVEQTTWLGGMLTSAGVSCTDGNDSLPSGIWSAFRKALYTHYGTHNLATGWVSETCFEPHVGDSILKSWVAREQDIKVLYEWYFEKTLMDKGKVIGAQFKNKKAETLTVKSQISIDATELGDLFAGAGAVYDLGTEDAQYANEKMAPGKTDIIQDITWTAILKDYGSNSSAILDKPPGYDPQQYYCSCTSAPCHGKAYPADATRMLNYARLPNDKYMINWPAHGNDFYLNAVEKNPQEREKEYQQVKTHTLGFIYFIQTELGFKNLGLAKDELNQGMALIPYNREGRRLRGVVRFNVNAIVNPFDQATSLYKTGIAVGDYPVDHHHGQNSKTPNIDFPPIPSFNIPIGCLIPDKTDGLIVCEKGISVSNIVNGATRLQPVVLLTGQAAGMLAALCIKKDCQPRQVKVREIQQKLLDLKCYLMPYIDVSPEDDSWEAVQHIGASGILKGTGQSSGWANKTYFLPDSPIRYADLITGLREFRELATLMPVNDHSISDPTDLEGNLNIEQLEFILWSLRKRLFETTSKNEPEWRNQFRIFWTNKIGKEYDPELVLNRKEVAVVLDHFLKPFSEFPIKINGNE